MINVVDIIMGGGKSSAAITYINEHPDERYLYVTPFLDETERVVRDCAGAHFVMPSDKIPEYRFRKSSHLRSLVNQRRNVAMTHALFLMIDDVTARAIADNGYTIFIDEVIEVFEPMRESEHDIGMLVESGYLELVKGDDQCEYYHPSEKAVGYNGTFSGLFDKARFGQIVRTSGWDNGKETKYGLWQVNLELFRLSERIFILTYLFDGMPMRGFIESNGLPYKYMGTRKCEDGKYRFCQKGELPAYVGHLTDMIHVCEKSKLNEIGEGRTALSVAWFTMARQDGRLAELRKHIHAYFRRHIPQDILAKKRLWTTFKAFEDDVRERGFGDFLVYNSKAVNTYGDRAALAYCVNIMPNPNLKNYLAHAGIRMDWDKYALANMVQWIWRSRIRNNQEIWIYVPSSRMRKLLTDWMKEAEAAYRKEHEVTV